MVKIPGCFDFEFSIVGRCDSESENMIVLLVLLCSLCGEGQKYYFGFGCKFTSMFIKRKTKSDKIEILYFYIYNIIIVNKFTIYYIGILV